MMKARLLIAAVVVTTLTTIPAAGETICSYDDEAHEVTVIVEDTVELSVVAGALTYASPLPSACGAATVTNTDTVEIDASAADRIVFDLSSPFAPGFTDEEDGSSEIEMMVLSSSDDLVLEIVGSDGDDHLRLNRTTAVPPQFPGLIADAMNLDTSEAVDDTDLLWHPGPESSAEVDGGSGDDVLDVTGPGHDDSSVDGVGYPEALEFIGGSGNDRLVTADSGPDSKRFDGGGGIDTIDVGRTPKGEEVILQLWIGGFVGSTPTELARVERAIGHSGADSLLSRAGSQFLIGGKGVDRLVGGGGDDMLEGGPGRDMLDGGKGRDKCASGPGRDVVKRCELGGG